MKDILIFLICLALVSVAFIAFNKGLDKTEMAECYKLQQQAIHYSNKAFYITSWQDEMCNTHGIRVNAPIR